MDNKVTVVLYEAFTEEDVRDLDNIKVGKYILKASRFPDPGKDKGGGGGGAGGPGWEGVVIVAAATFIAEGFLSEIGKDAYNWLKEKLFEKKRKVKPTDAKRFTINILMGHSTAFFHLTDLNKADFFNALNKANEAFTKNKGFIAKKGGWFDFKFDRQSKKWKLEESKTFGI